MDRECSLRRYLEEFDTQCETFGTPVSSEWSSFTSRKKVSFIPKFALPPVTPKYLIKEVGSTAKREKDAHFSKHSHSFHSGWLISQTLGFWSAFRLAANIFRPSHHTSCGFLIQTYGRFSKLTIENKSLDDRENDLQIGFTIEEMANRVEGVLKALVSLKTLHRSCM
jgi:uncharacterized protein YbcC (UPF0753/DUF2309 family)